MLRLTVVVCLLAGVWSGSISRTKEEIEGYREYLETVSKGNGPKVPTNSAWANSGRYQGDIVLDAEQIAPMVNQFASDDSNRHAYIWPGTLWPARTVVYEFAPGHFDAAQQNWILSMMQFITQHTCIRFRRRNPGEFNYALITGHSDGCYAHVGYWAGRGVHTINVARNRPGWGCLHGTVIVHEWLHIIGFFHMHSTYNRDTYVRINWHNMIRGMEYAFERYGQNMVSNLGLPYEYDSNMHYGPAYFSANGRPTIDPLRPLNGVVMGQIDYITGFDFWRVDRHYGCQAWRGPEYYKNVKLPEPPTDEELNEERKDKPES